MKEIPLTQGMVALVNDSDFERLSKYTWYSKRTSGKRLEFYAQRDDLASGLHKHIYMHREIMAAPSGLQVDHINFDGLDNRRDNLRLCTRSENSWHTRKYVDGKHKYKGVSQDPRTTLAKRWKAQISSNNMRRDSKRFATAVEAAHAYDDMARQYHGEFAVLNFPTESAR